MNQKEDRVCRLGVCLNWAVLSLSGNRSHSSPGPLLAPEAPAGHGEGAEAAACG